MGHDTEKVSKYIRRRTRRVYFPILEEALEREGFEIEGPDHPHAVVRALTVGDASVFADTKAGDFGQGIGMVALSVKSFGGDWSLYDGALSEVPQWPAVDDDDLEGSIKARRKVLLSLCADDMRALVELATSLNTVSKAEKKPSGASSRSAPTGASNSLNGRSPAAESRASASP